MHVRTKRLKACYLVRLSNGAEGYQRRADHRVPDQTFVPQLHHQPGLQMTDLTGKKDKHITYITAKVKSSVPVY